MIICLCLLFAGRASAQWVFSDPGTLAQGIINASKNISHTSKTDTNKNRAVSYLRAKKKNDLDRIMGLDGNMNERYW